MKSPASITAIALLSLGWTLVAPLMAQSNTTLPYGFKQTWGAPAATAKGSL